jgi:hypothetical protein
MTDLMRLRRTTEHENKVEGGGAQASGSVCGTSIRVGDCLEVGTLSEDPIPHDRLTRLLVPLHPQPYFHARWCAAGA